jgi:hypothetical protein
MSFGSLNSASTLAYESTSDMPELY